MRQYVYEIRKGDALYQCKTMSEVRDKLNEINEVSLYSKDMINNYLNRNCKNKRRYFATVNLTRQLLKNKML